MSVVSDVTGIDPCPPCNWVLLNQHVQKRTFAAAVVRLHVSHCHIADSPWTWLVNVIPALANMVELDVAGTAMTDARCRALVESLSVDPRVRGGGTAQRSRSPTTRNAKREPPAWHDHRGSLVSLNVSGNKLTERSAHPIGHWMTQCSRLQVVDLSHNRFGDHGAQVLAAHLKLVSGTFVNLAFASNGCSIRGIVDVLVGASEAPNLHDLDLSGNHAGGGGAGGVVAQKSAIPTAAGTPRGAPRPTTNAAAATQQPHNHNRHHPQQHYGDSSFETPSRVHATSNVPSPVTLPSALRGLSAADTSVVHHHHHRSVSEASTVFEVRRSVPMLSPPPHGGAGSDASSSTSMADHGHHAVPQHHHQPGPWFPSGGGGGRRGHDRNTVSKPAKAVPLPRGVLQRLHRGCMLAVLNLNGCGITAEHAVDLLPALLLACPRLASLWIHDNLVGDAATWGIAAAVSALVDEALGLVTPPPGMILRPLQLADRGASSVLRRLALIDLSLTGVSDAGLEHVAEALCTSAVDGDGGGSPTQPPPPLKRLEELCVAGCPITADGVVSFLTSLYDGGFSVARLSKAARSKRTGLARALRIDASRSSVHTYSLDDLDLVQQAVQLLEGCVEVQVGPSRDGATIDVTYFAPTGNDTTTQQQQRYPDDALEVSDDEGEKPESVSALPHRTPPPQHPTTPDVSEFADHRRTASASPPTSLGPLRSFSAVAAERSPSAGLEAADSSLQQHHGRGRAVAAETFYTAAAAAKSPVAKAVDYSAEPWTAASSTSRAVPVEDDPHPQQQHQQQGGLSTKSSNNSPHTPRAATTSPPRVPFVDSTTAAMAAEAKAMALAALARSEPREEEGSSPVSRNNNAAGPSSSAGAAASPVEGGDPVLLVTAPTTVFDEDDDSAASASFSSSQNNKNRRTPVEQPRATSPAHSDSSSSSSSLTEETSFVSVGMGAMSPAGAAAAVAVSSSSPVAPSRGETPTSAAHTAQPPHTDGGGGDGESVQPLASNPPAVTAAGHRSPSPPSLSEAPPNQVLDTAAPTPTLKGGINGNAPVASFNLSTHDDMDDGEGEEDVADDSAVMAVPIGPQPVFPDCDDVLNAAKDALPRVAQMHSLVLRHAPGHPCCRICHLPRDAVLNLISADLQTLISALLRSPAFIAKHVRDGKPLAAHVHRVAVYSDGSASVMVRSNAKREAMNWCLKAAESVATPEESPEAAAWEAEALPPTMEARFPRCAALGAWTRLGGQVTQDAAGNALTSAPATEAEAQDLFDAFVLREMVEGRVSREEAVESYHRRHGDYLTLSAELAQDGWLDRAFRSARAAAQGHHQHSRSRRTDTHHDDPSAAAAAVDAPRVSSPEQPVELTEDTTTTMPAYSMDFESGVDPSHPSASSSAAPIATNADAAANTNAPAATGASTVDDDGAAAAVQAAAQAIVLTTPDSPPRDGANGSQQPSPPNGAVVALGAPAAAGGGGLDSAEATATSLNNTFVNHAEGRLSFTREGTSPAESSFGSPAGGGLLFISSHGIPGLLRLPSTVECPPSSFISPAIQMTRHVFTLPDGVSPAEALAPWIAPPAPTTDDDASSSNVSFDIEPPRATGQQNTATNSAAPAERTLFDDMNDSKMDVGITSDDVAAAAVPSANASGSFAADAGAADGPLRRSQTTRLDASSTAAPDNGATARSLRGANTAPVAADAQRFVDPDARVALSRQRSGGVDVTGSFRDMLRERGQRSLRRLSSTPSSARRARSIAAQSTPEQQAPDGSTSSPQAAPPPSDFRRALVHYEAQRHQALEAGGSPNRALRTPEARRARASRLFHSAYRFEHIGDLPLPSEERHKLRICKGLYNGERITVSVEWSDFLVFKHDSAVGMKEVFLVHPLVGNVSAHPLCVPVVPVSVKETFRKPSSKVNELTFVLDRPTYQPGPGGGDDGMVPLVDDPPTIVLGIVLDSEWVAADVCKVLQDAVERSANRTQYYSMLRADRGSDSPR